MIDPKQLAKIEAGLREASELLTQAESILGSAWRRTKKYGEVKDDEWDKSLAILLRIAQKKAEASGNDAARLLAVVTQKK